MKKTKAHRFFCGVCALAILFVTTLPVAAFAQENEPVQSMSAADVQQMQQVDAAVTALTDSENYAQMPLSQRIEAAQAQLDELVAQGLIRKDSIYLDEESGMFSFAYTCGALGGILLTEEEDLGAQELGAEMETALETALLEAENGSIGKATIFYAFDDTVNSTRYPYYAYMQKYWTALGLDTVLDTEVTVSDLRKMGKDELYVLSAHGADYTYQYGWLFKRQTTQPVILLTEEAGFWSDLRYGWDLLNHRIIKINGKYAVTAELLQAAYRSNQLEGSIILSETCEFYGRNEHPDASLAQAFLDGGAETVVGYVNNVYAVYSRSVVWSMVNDMIGGSTVQQAMENAQELYGDNDIIWYYMQGRKHPHAAASYPVLLGRQDATLWESSSAGTQWIAA